MAFKRKNRGWWAWIDYRQTQLKATNKRAAEREERALRQADRTECTHNATPSVAQLCNEYVMWMQSYKAATTFKTLAPVALSFGVFLGALPAESVTPEQVEDWLRTTKCKKPGSFSRRITFICGIFNWGVKTKRIKCNPIEGMPRPACPRREVVLPADRYPELMRQVDTCPAMRDYLLFMLDTGARAEEMHKLCGEHFDLQTRIATIPASLVKGRHRDDVGPRVIHLPDVAYGIAVRLVGTYPQGPIFRNSRGAPYNKDAVNSYMRRLAKRMGIPGLCATAMRHSYATHRIKSGQDIGTVGKLLGHKDAQMVYKTYGHLDSSYLSQQAAAVQLPVHTT